MIEQRAVDDRGKPGLTDSGDYLVKCNVRYDLYAEPLQHCGISVDAANPKFGSPLRAIVPSPTCQSNRSYALVDRLDGGEQRLHLRPALPIVPDIGHAVSFAAG